MFDNCTQCASASDEPFIQQNFITILKGICFAFIIISALFGNVLVFIAVLRFQRLRRVRTNIFLVSLALADFLVALLVMPISACVSLLNGQWLFGRVFCDVFNANDVSFSTASILHLCCISTERYIAVLNPLSYERKMTKLRIGIMLGVTWLVSFLISYIPIIMGLHTTAEYRLRAQSDPQLCAFVVNLYYAMISSFTSFWGPAVVMVIVYIRIFMEARKQEKKIHKLQTVGKPNDRNVRGLTNGGRKATNREETTTRNSQCMLQVRQVHRASSRIELSAVSEATRKPLFTGHKPVFCDNSESSNNDIKEHMKIRRERKAAKTLGLIMGAFILCWLPFFLWYTIIGLCGGFCHYPPVIYEILFWIGYVNSTLNPVIYAFYNRNFRRAFKEILLCSICKKSRRSFNGGSRSPYMRRRCPSNNLLYGTDSTPSDSRP